MDSKKILRRYLLPCYAGIIPEKLLWVINPFLARRYGRCMKYLIKAELLDDAVQQLQDSENQEEFGLSYGLRGEMYRHLGYLTKDYAFFAKRGVVIPYRQVTSVYVDTLDSDAGTIHLLRVSTDYLEDVWAVELNSDCQDLLMYVCNYMRCRMA